MPLTSALSRTMPTHCPYCAMQCGMTLVEDEDRWSVAARDFPTNKGGLCRKGWTAANLLNAPDRLTTPLMRDGKNGDLRPSSWPEALDRIAQSLKSIAAESGPDAIGVFGGGGLSNEKAYLLGKFARVALRTANIDYNGRFCMASAAVAGLRAFGIDRGMPFPMEDIAGILPRRVVRMTRSPSKILRLRAISGLISTNGSGSAAVLKARLSRDIRFDTLFAPFHWSGAGSANLLTNAALDPTSKIPEFKVCAVRIERAPVAAFVKGQINSSAVH